MTDAQLYDILTQSKKAELSAKTVIADIEAILLDRHYTAAMAAFARQSRTSGKLTIGAGALGGGQPMTAEIKKKVDWNTDKLMGAAEWLMGQRGWSWERVRNFFKVEFAVPEREYKSAVAAANETGDDALIDKLIDARTTTYSPLTVRFVQKGGEQ